MDSPRKEKKSTIKSNTTMMTKDANHSSGNSPSLHDLSCIGVDTCSARSISCFREDFLDLDLTPGKKEDQLIGIGGTNGVAGKGGLVFYVRDVDGKMKALLEPKGFFLENPPAKFG